VGSARNVDSSSWLEFWGVFYSRIPPLAPKSLISRLLYLPCEAGSTRNDGTMKGKVEYRATLGRQEHTRQPCSLARYISDRPLGALPLGVFPSQSRSHCPGLQLQLRVILTKKIPISTEHPLSCLSNQPQPQNATWKKDERASTTP
jgi:hypothetical protein